MSPQRELHCAVSETPAQEKHCPRARPKGPGTQPPPSLLVLSVAELAEGIPGLSSVPSEYVQIAVQTEEKLSAIVI